jgi:hypothetical protein
MNEAATSQSKHLIYRRLTDTIDLFGESHSGDWWLLILGLILVAGFFYIGWMYLKDSRSVGPWWASLLGALRACAYLVLAWAFLLLAEQTVEDVEWHSKVLVLLDVSGSMGAIDDVPTGAAGEKLLSRQEKVLELLAGDKARFLQALEAKNPVTVHRFGVRVDEDYLLLRDGHAGTRSEWEAASQAAEPEAALPELRPLGREFWKAFLMPGLREEQGAGWTAAQKQRYTQLLALNKKLGESGVFSGTNVGDSVFGVVNREKNNRVMPQGVIIISDGHSTEGSAETIHKLERQAKEAHIPIFVVAVGDERPQVRIKVADLRVPDLVQPDDKFRAVVEVTGEGLAEQKVDVELEMTHVRQPGTPKETTEEITLVEAKDERNKGDKRETISLGKKLKLRPAEQAFFDRGTPPRASVEFPIDATVLAALAGKDLTKGELAHKKWEISESAKDGEYRFVARVPRAKLEPFTGTHHESEPAALHVIDKPLRVLLFASAPTHDYQFLRTLLTRSKDRSGRDRENDMGELSIHLQLPPGRTERRIGVVQDVDPERLLSDFPTHLESETKTDLYALDEYDVVVAFDPDWTKLSEKQLKMLQTWVDKGGGLIVEGGPINTLQLARPGSYKNQLKPVLELLPVVLRDVRIDDLDRSTAEPWALDFTGATPDLEFLRLDESQEKDFLQDWKEFFFGQDFRGKWDDPPVRGFYNYYPVEAAKGGAHVVARFTDPKARIKDGDRLVAQPFLVLSDPNSHRHVVWLGWGETRRLRQYREAYFERFWTKLLRYAAAGHRTRMHKRLRLEMGASYVANEYVDVTAKIDGKGGEPLSKDAKRPEITLTMPAGVAEKEIPQPVLMQAKPGSDGWFTAHFQVRSPGNYRLHLKVPDTGDTQSRPFSVKEANPELDNVQPDFEKLYQLASVADEVLARMSDADRQELKKRLQRPRQIEGVETKPRLYFDLESAKLIPSCMIKDDKTDTIPGKVKDLWDEGFTLWQRPTPQEPVKLPYVLVAVVGLLSAEWLIRKLLRLA